MAQCLMHPTELVFLARHVVGQIQPGPGVAGCRWVPVATARQTLPPPAAELIQHANTGTAQATIGHQSLDTVARLRVARAKFGARADDTEGRLHPMGISWEQDCGTR